MEDKIEVNKITLKDYVLTNLHPFDNWGYFIRLKDGEEYQVYFRKPKKGKRIYYIKKDNKELVLDEEVRECFISEKATYDRVGI